MGTHIRTGTEIFSVFRYTPDSDGTSPVDGHLAEVHCTGEDTTHAAAAQAYYDYARDNQQYGRRGKTYDGPIIVLHSSSIHLAVQGRTAKVWGTAFQQRTMQFGKTVEVPVADLPRMYENWRSGLRKGSEG